MSKTVLTYSWLAKRAMSLLRRNPEAYRELRLGMGTDKLVRGLIVHWRGHEDYYQPFVIWTPGSADTYATIHGVIRDGKVYSWYTMKFATTKYKKRITDKYMPITLPEGVKSRSNGSGTTKCIYHNADGSEAAVGYWQGGRRNRLGYGNYYLIVRDEDGKFVGNDNRLFDSLGFSSAEECCEILTHLGWFEGASANRAAWLESIKNIPESMCDHRRMLSVAAKAYLTAAKMTQQYPAMRMALFPAVPYSDDTLASFLQLHRHGIDSTPQTVMSRSVDGWPELYNLPEVLLYWDEKVPGNVAPRFIRLSMTIPPHGNPLLDPTGKASPTGKTTRFKPDGRWNDYRVPEAYEQAYHSLRCWDRKSLGETTGRPPRWYDYQPYPSEAYDKQDERLVFWPRNENKVMVEVRSTNLDSSEVGLPLPMDTPIGMKPEDVAAIFEEKFLLESLPLC